MNTMRTKKAASFFAVLLLSGTLLLGGCVNLTQTDSPSTPSVPSGPSTGAREVKVVYNYNDTDKVQLSGNDLVLKVGEKLVLQPAAGLTKNTRFKSAGKYFIGDIMKQETDQHGKVVFTAVKAGKGQLQIIPDTDKEDRAVDLRVTVE
ncbi:hypothetical protein [Anaeroselena agilis]|uniref:Lipoprotein n=1 Tax=Anaeroselena agilis TaxID=3063788 RepID=A0ABU3P214_9FIRM|nr:hypothetical protein [Selenomonadales bacterium 4137-cl]